MSTQEITFSDLDDNLTDTNNTPFVPNIDKATNATLLDHLVAADSATKFTLAWWVGITLGRLIRKTAANLVRGTQPSTEDQDTIDSFNEQMSYWDQIAEGNEFNTLVGVGTRPATGTRRLELLLGVRRFLELEGYNLEPLHTTFADYDRWIATLQVSKLERQTIATVAGVNPTVALARAQKDLAKRKPVMMAENRAAFDLVRRSSHEVDLPDDLFGQLPDLESELRSMLAKARQAQANRSGRQEEILSTIYLIRQIEDA